MGTYSLLLPFMPQRPKQLVPFAALVQRTAAQRLWQGQSLTIEPHQGFAYAAGAGFPVPAGIGVSLMALRHPYEAAMAARSLALVTGQSVVAGFGPGSGSFQQAMLGAAYASPLTAARDYVTAVRLALGSGLVQMAGVSSPAVEVGLGVLRPGMARLAGEVADVAITWLTPAAYLRQVIMPALHEGAVLAGRPMPRVTAIVPMALAAADREPAELLLAGSRAHLQAPHYLDMLRRAGAAFATGDSPEVVAKAALACGAFLSGTPEDLCALIADYHDVGVDEVVISVTGVCVQYGIRAGLTELTAIIRALG
ncbi:LLM class flavin-dependent oxidoreductase [Micromonospora sp. NIE79]|uniref:LLM class flavin-dependent oxidoreductase n=1 Tax=Micromonospora trifolii TaxID=2911208 RepID=A0ABS9N2T5_9ACTN|nr:LLM class flavin-dependent oxidoreductase [Micromonospora trifolii]MCG5444043.1 LLM class flavin-dependent oxidoreductase [Micromonospora trifolii]